MATVCSECGVVEPRAPPAVTDVLSRCVCSLSDDVRRCCRPPAQAFRFQVECVPRPVTRPRHIAALYIQALYNLSLALAAASTSPLPHFTMSPVQSSLVPPVSPAGPQGKRTPSEDGDERKSRTLILCFDGTASQYDGDVRMTSITVYFQLTVSLVEHQRRQALLPLAEGRRQ